MVIRTPQYIPHNYPLTSVVFVDTLRHIEKVFGFFAPEGLTKSEREDWALAFSHRMNALVGADANNMIGQLSQWLNSKRRDTPQHDATRLMLRRVTEIRPEFEREIGLWLNSRD